MSIEKMLVISTGHLQQDVAETITAAWEDRSGFGALLSWLPAFVRDEGFLFYIEPARLGALSHDLPPCLRASLEVAIKAGVEWIMFDRDGDRLQELPFYDW